MEMSVLYLKGQNSWVMNVVVQPLSLTLKVLVATIDAQWEGG